MQGHTGGAMSFGWGLVHKKVPNQKLNSKSTMVYQVVRVTEYIPYKIYFINFMKAQDYHIKKKVLYQDNESAIKMDNNGQN